MPLNEQSKQWLADKSKKAKGIKANSDAYKDGWERIFGGKENGKAQDLQEGSDSKDTDEA